MRFDIVCDRCLAWLLLLRRLWAAIARSSGQVLSRCLLTSVGCGIPDVRRLLMLPDGRAVASRAAAVAARAAAAAAATAWVPRVRRAELSVGAIVAAGARRRARSRIVVPSLVVAGGVATLGAGRTAVVAGVVAGSTLGGGARGRVSSTPGAGPCAAVTDRVILVVV